MGERTLLVGYDLCDDRAQLAVYDAEKMEPLVIGETEDNPNGWIETVVELEDGTRYDDFLRKIRLGEELEVSTPTNVLAYFFRKTLSLTRKTYPGETIRQLVVTVPDQTLEYTRTIYDALEVLGIGKDRALVIGHPQSFLYFSMYQKKDLWVNDVGLFEYSRDALVYYQMKTDRRSRPMLVGCAQTDYSEALELMGEDGVKNASVLANVAEGAIHKQILSALYMTGEKFEEEWTDPVLKKLCVGRRLFKGSNLYVSGACYAAKEMRESPKLSDYLLINDDMILDTLQMAVYKDAKEEPLLLAKAGTPWYQVDEDVDIIPDGDTHIDIRTKNIFTRQEQNFEIPLEPVLGKVERQCRLSLRVRFADPVTCIVTVKDQGFGELFPTSNRIWEHQLRLSNGEVK